MKVYIFPKFKKCDNFSPYKHKMMQRLHLAAWTLYHFLENFRSILTWEHPGHMVRPESAGEGASGGCCWCQQSVKRLLQTYPGTDIISAYHFYELCRQHLYAASRAPSAGRLRAKKSPTDADLVQFMVLGGIPELCKLSLLKGSANQRIEIIAGFVDKVSSAAIQQRLRENGSAVSSQTEESSLVEDLVSSLQTPFHLIFHRTISAVPDIDRFIAGTDEWVTQMYARLDPGDQIVSAWGFITNILAGKSEEPTDSQGGSCSSGLDSDLDFLAPVKSLG